MKRSTHLFGNAFAVSLFVWTAAIAAPLQPAILAINLDALRIDGKVSGVLWTRRADIFTLQVLLLRPPRGNGWAKVDAWLLRADGSRIPAIGSPKMPNCPNIRCIGSEAEFSFSLEAGKQAAEVAIAVDGDIHTERLKPLDD